LDRPPQLDSLDFRLLSDEEFKALSLAERLAYLRRAIEFRKYINRQIEETLFKDLDGSIEPLSKSRETSKPT